MINVNKSAVALWIAPENNEYGIKPGYKSWGVWTFSLPYLTTYRIEDDKGNIIKYRFDIMNKLSIQNDFVSFNDLIIDCIIKINDNNKHIILFEDEEELENEIKNNKLTKEQIDIISSTKQLLKLHAVMVITNIINLVHGPELHLHLPLLVVAVSPLLDLHRSLAHDTRSAAKCSPNIPHGVALYVVPLPGLLPEEKGGDAGHDAAQQAVQQPTLAHVFSCPVGQTGCAAKSTAADTHVTTAVKHSLLPLTSHPGILIYLL